MDNTTKKVKVTNMAKNVLELPRKQHKVDRQKALAGIKLTPVEPPKAVDTPKPEPKVEPKADTPKTEKAKKTRKWSQHHLNWKATKDFPETARIVVLSADNPKKRNAAKRFDFYKRGAEGMTVGEYIEASHKAGNPKALAKEDVKWDYTAGFISIDGQKAPPNTKA